MSELVQIQKEAKMEAILLQFINFYKQNKLKFISLILLIVILFSSYIGYYFYNKDINQKYSVILQEIFLKEKIDSDELKILVEQNNSDGIKFISSMQYAKTLINNNKIDKAIDLYILINRNNDYDGFFREYAGLLAVKYLVSLNDNKKYDIIDNIIKIKSESVNLKSHIIEQEAIYYWKNGKNNESKNLFQSLIDDFTTSKEIKNRSIMMLEIGFIDK